MNYAWGGGINNSGDFDQLSLAGVDFGEDYCENYGIVPTNLQGDVMYGGHLDQLGMDYHQMGVIPEGMGADFDQMGVVPAGYGGYHNQMGHSQYSQLGGIPAGLGGIMDQFNALSQTHKMLVGGAVVVAAYVGAQKFLGFKGFGLPVIG